MSENSIECSKCGTRYKAPKEPRRASLPCKKCGAMIELAPPPAPKPPPETRRSPAPAHAVHHDPHAHAHGHAHAHRRHHDGSRKGPTAEFYVLTGVVGVAGIVGLIYLLPGTRAPEFRETASAAAPKKTTPSAPVPVPKAPTLVPTYTKPEAAAPAGGATPGSAPAAEKVVHPPQKLEHLAETSPDQRARIDAALAKLLDLSNPRPGALAASELVELGKPAIPLVLSSWVDLNMSDGTDAIRGNLLDQVLRQITRRGSNYTPEGTSAHEIQRRERARNDWFQWWGDSGAKLSPPKPESGG